MDIKYSLLLAINLCFQSTVIAQFYVPDPDEAKEFISRPTLYVEDFFSTDQQRDWLREHWMFDHEIIFLTTEELEEKAKEEKPGAAFLSGGERDEYIGNYEGERGNRRYVKDYMYQFSIVGYLSEKATDLNEIEIDLIRKEDVVRLSWESKPTTEAGIFFMCQHFYNLLTKADGTAYTSIPSIRAAQLKDMEVYFPKVFDKTSAAELSEKSGLLIKAVDYETFSEAVLSKDSNVAYATVLYSDQHMTPNLFIIDAGTGQPVIECSIVDVQFGNQRMNPRDPNSTDYVLGNLTVGKKAAYSMRFYYKRGLRKEKRKNK